MESFPSASRLRLGSPPPAASPTSPGLSDPCEQLLQKQRSLSVSRPSCSFSQMSSCLHPPGPVPLGLTGPTRGHSRPPVPMATAAPNPHPALTAQEAGLVEAAALALHLLGEVHGLLADPTFLASSPVRHSETGQKGELRCRAVGTQAAQDGGLQAARTGPSFPTSSSSCYLGPRQWD